MTQPVTHMLPDELMLAYSMGQLPAAFDLVVACHVSLSEEAQVQLGSFDALGGAVLETSETASMSAGSLDATLALIAGGPAPVPVRPRPGVFPHPLQDMVGGDLDQVRWSPMGMGVQQAILTEESGCSARLLSIPPGAAVPDHGHSGLEMTLVLKGAYRDELGEYHRGDIEVADEDLEHTPQVIGDETCICLAATVSRLKFNSLLPKLAQPFLRI